MRAVHFVVFTVAAIEVKATKKKDNEKAKDKDELLNSSVHDPLHMKISYEEATGTAMSVHPH